jgi:hypothetical protein
VKFTAHAYPWDVIGDPGFVSRLAGHGIDRVSLAAAYHCVRAATPLHPRHQVVSADHAALYRPIRESAWRGQPLRPLAADWAGSADSFGEAAKTLRDNGISVTAWIVLSHNSRLGAQHPRWSVKNCFDEHYPYALCPSHEPVRRYCATLAAEAVHNAAVDEVSLEACGQLGIGHAGHHDKTDGAWTPAAARWLSVCCCEACRSQWRQRGADADAVTARLREAVHGEAAGAPSPPPPQLSDLLLSVRHSATDALRTGVLAALAAVAPGLPVTLHGHPDPWVTGPAPGLTAAATTAVDSVLVPAWPTGEATAEVVSAAVAFGTPVDAYLTVLAPSDPIELLPHARRLAAAGARGLNLYHLGLAPRWRQPHFSELVRGFT